MGLLSRTYSLYDGRPVGWLLLGKVLFELAILICSLFLLRSVEHVCRSCPFNPLLNVDVASVL